MHGWRLRLLYFWRDHRAGIVGMALCVAIGAATLVVLLSLIGVDLSLKPPAATLAEGTIVGFIGGDTRYSTGPSALFRTRDSDYGVVGLPFSSGCQNGDRIFLTQWQVSGRPRFRVRPPGCLRTSAPAAP